MPNLTSVYIKKDNLEIKAIIEKAFQITLSVSLACAICYIIFGKQILEFLYSGTLSKEELLISTKLLFLGGINLIFLSLVYVSGSVLQGMGKQNQAAKAILLGSLIKIFMTILLVSFKDINIFGAMVSGAVSYVCIFGINYKNIRSITDVRITELFFDLAMQECLVCLFAFFANRLFNVIFGARMALFGGGVVAIVIFAITYYIFYLIEQPKRISS